MGTRAATAEALDKLRLKVRGDGVFQALGFIVHLVPLHAEKLGEHALDEVVAQGKLVRDLPACSSQSYLTAGQDAHQTVSLQAAQCHGHRRRRNGEPVRQGRRNDGLALAFGFENGLEVVFLGDGNHLG